MWWQRSPATRRRLFLEQDALCFYCSRPMTFLPRAKDRDGSNITIEHLVPLSQGGPRLPWNEVGACQRCNHARGDGCWITFYCSKDEERERHSHSRRHAIKPWEQAA
jgi:hypothetical protein